MTLRGQGRRTKPLTPRGARALAPLLDELVVRSLRAQRIGFDPVELPHRYLHSADIEVVALLSSALAYGRADLFKPKVDRLLEAMGPSPADFVAALDVAGVKRLLDGFVYRFNVGTDVAVLLLAMGWAVRERGGLEPVFVEQLALHGALRGAVAGFTRRLRDSVPMGPLRKALGRERGLDHLLPAKAGAGAAKRLMLFLRWMVRGPDEIDFGLWKSVRASTLIIPLDTHIGRLAKHLGLTRRSDLSWRTAEEITQNLRLVDGGDPVRYDFALCHHGMSGACPSLVEARHCEACVLQPACRTGRRLRRRG